MLLRAVTFDAIIFMTITTTIIIIIIHGNFDDSGRYNNLSFIALIKFASLLFLAPS